jgi:hypothetical protein
MKQLYEESRLYRDFSMNLLDLSGKIVKVLKGEKILKEEKDVFYWQGDKCKGKILITNIRVIWMREGAEKWNMSAPYLCMDFVREEEKEKEKIMKILYFEFKSRKEMEGKSNFMRGFRSFALSFYPFLPVSFFFIFFFSFIFFSFFSFSFSFSFFLFFSFLFLFLFFFFLPSSLFSFSFVFLIYLLLLFFPAYFLNISVFLFFSLVPLLFSSGCQLSMQIEPDKRRKGVIEVIREELRERREKPIFGFDVFEGKKNGRERMRKREVGMGRGGDGELERMEKEKKGEEEEVVEEGEKEKKKKGNSLLSYLLVSLFFI